MTKLKPCPFCGGTLTIVGSIPAEKWFWQCRACNIDSFRDFGTESEAIADANRRAPDHEIASLLRDMIDALRWLLGSVAAQRSELLARAMTALAAAEGEKE